MEFRFLGNSGLNVSAISHGKWVTHGSQVEADQATACLRVTLEADVVRAECALRRSQRVDARAVAGRSRAGSASRRSRSSPTSRSTTRSTGLSSRRSCDLPADATKRKVCERPDRLNDATQNP